MRFTFRRKASTELPTKPVTNQSQWTRWGYGNSEGYTFWVGERVKGYVIREDGTPHAWLAYSGHTELGRYQCREAAMARVEGKSVSPDFVI